MAWTEGPIFMCSQVNGLYWLKQLHLCTGEVQTYKFKNKKLPWYYSFKADLSRVIRASLYICVPEITWYPWHPLWAGFHPWDEESQPFYLRSSSHKKNLNFIGLWYSVKKKKKSKPIQKEKEIIKTIIKNSKFSSSQHKKRRSYIFPLYFCL